MCLEEGNEKRILPNGMLKTSANGLENALVFPYNESSHWSLFILDLHCTLHFDSISGYHSTHKANQFLKCVTFRWSYTKGILHNSNKQVVVGIRPIICVPMPKQNRAWECICKIF
jgi:Ulp1 family protease